MSDLIDVAGGWYLHYANLFFLASGNTDSQHTDSLQDGAGVGWDERSELYYQAALLRKSEILSLRNHTLASSTVKSG